MRLYWRANQSSICDRPYSSRQSACHSSFLRRSGGPLRMRRCSMQSERRKSQLQSQATLLSVPWLDSLLHSALRAKIYAVIRLPRRRGAIIFLMLWIGDSCSDGLRRQRQLRESPVSDGGAFCCPPPGGASHSLDASNYGAGALALSPCRRRIRRRGRRTEWTSEPVPSSL